MCDAELVDSEGLGNSHLDLAGIDQPGNLTVLCRARLGVAPGRRDTAVAIDPLSEVRSIFRLRAYAIACGCMRVELRIKG